MQEENFTFKIFQTRLAEAIASNSLTQKELSLSTQIAQSAISKYLSGKALPRTLELCKLAQALGVSMDWLCGLEPRQLTTDALKEENVRLRASLSVAVGTLEGALVTLRRDLQIP